MAPNSDPPQNAQPLKERCIEAALLAIRDNGVESLSLRQVARRLLVSHQAPYKHFASRDHLLAEVIRRCLKGFAEALRNSELGDNGHPKPPQEAMRDLGHCYLTYAVENALEYRLMFGTPWPEVARDIDLRADARAAFDVLCTRLSALKRTDANVHTERDAMFVWSAMHGLATVMQSEAAYYLDMPQDEAQAQVLYTMESIDLALRQRGYEPL